MPDKYHAHRCIVITLLFSSIVVGVTSSEKPAPAEQTLEAIEDCISRTPSRWPDGWKQQYLETIRSAIEQHRNVPHYPMRLEILRKGFVPYWEGLSKTKDRSLFEVYQARIRWYTEHLMGTNFPTAEERKRLRDQYTDSNLINIIN